MSEEKKDQSLVGLIRRAQSSKLSYLFASNNVIDLQYLCDLNREAVRMAGVSMMSDVFIEEFNQLVNLGEVLRAVVAVSFTSNDFKYETLNAVLNPSGYLVKEMEPDPLAAPLNQIGKTILVAEPYQFIIKRWS